MPRDGACLVNVTGVESGLSAARLRLGKINLVAQPLQHLRDSDAHLGENLIDDAGNE
jgi:hypothetical protein